LGLSIEAVRQRAIRNKWARMLGNDKRARIRLPDHPALTSALESHIKTLQADNEALRQQLATADAERAKAIGAFSDLADRLDALAAERRRPWWRRIMGA